MTPKIEPKPHCAVPKCADFDLVSMKVSRTTADGRTRPEVMQICRSHAQMTDPRPKIG